METLQLIPFEDESKHTLSRLAAQPISETKFFKLTSKSGEYEILSSVNLGKKELRTPNVVLISELRESRVTCGSEDSGDLSLRDACLGKPRSTIKMSFNPTNVVSRCKGDNGKGMKGGHKEGTQKQKVRKVHIVALMDIHHIQKYEYIRRMFASSIECSSHASHVKSRLNLV